MTDINITDKYAVSNDNSIKESKQTSVKIVQFTSVWDVENSRIVLHALADDGKIYYNTEKGHWQPLQPIYEDPSTYIDVNNVADLLNDINSKGS